MTQSEENDLRVDNSLRKKLLGISQALDVPERFPNIVEEWYCHGKQKLAYKGGAQFYSKNFQYEVFKELVYSV